MADINYGDGTGENDSQTANGYAYTAMASPTVVETFDGAGSVKTIKLYNYTNNGRLRIWKGTVSGLAFTFDDYTEIVDVDLTGKGTGWITLTAPTDFAAFDVTADTVLLFYSSTNTSNGTQIGRGNDPPNRYGYNSADPPYSSGFTFSVGGTTHRLEVKIEGDFPAPADPGYSCVV